jgi:GNAT superfamily N-acetyltransferase
MNMDIQYRFMQKGEEAKVCSLVEKVFNEFVAPDYEEEGINEFLKFANPLALADRGGSEQVAIVAEQGSDLVGIIEMSNCDHIAMLFVSLRSKGIAKELINRAVEECRKRKPELKRITVNSSPFAEPIYSRMGFKPTGSFQKKNGIAFEPMARDLE